MVVDQYVSMRCEDEEGHTETTTHVDLEHLFEIGDRIDHVVGPFLLDGDPSAVNAARELSVT